MVIFLKHRKRFDCVKQVYVRGSDTEISTHHVKGLLIVWDKVEFDKGKPSPPNTAKISKIYVNIQCSAPELELRQYREREGICPLNYGGSYIYAIGLI